MPTAKPIDTLTADDLIRHPIWEYALGDEIEHDETWVQPYPGNVVPSDIDHAVYHVACDVELASGRRLIGFMSLCNGHLHDPLPIVLGTHAGEYFAIDERPHRRNLAAYIAVFAGSPAQVFPARWRLHVLMDGSKQHLHGECAGPG